MRYTTIANGYYEIKDYQTAGYHFKTCMELEPTFPDVYFHFIHLLVFMNMEKQVLNVISKALCTPGVNLAEIYKLQGLFFEKNKNWQKAIQAYTNAFYEVTDKKAQEIIEDSLDRVNEKLLKSRPVKYQLIE